MLIKLNFSLLFCFFFLFSNKNLFAEIKIHEIQNVTSATAFDGKISIVIDGNSGPYEIQLWHGPKNISTLTNKLNGVHTFDGRGQGDYIIKVLDKNTSLNGVSSSIACVKTLAATIGVCTDMTIIETKSLLVCDGTKDGFIDITPQGGTAPYKYVWNIGKTTEDLSDLDGGKTYKVTVTDNQGCSARKEITLDWQKISINIEVIQGSKNGLSEGRINPIVKIKGFSSGTTKFGWQEQTIPSSTFQNGDPYIAKYSSGVYVLKVTSGLGCEISQTFNIPSCSSVAKPITFLTTDYIGGGVTKSYCNPKSTINVNVKGGDPYILCELRDDQNNNVFSPITIKNDLERDIKLAPPKVNMPNGVYTFKASDKCGNSAALDFNCNCGLSKASILLYNQIEGCMPDQNFFPAYKYTNNQYAFFVLQQINTWVLKKQYEIKFPDGQVSVVKTKGYFSQEPEYVGGPKKWNIDKTGNLTIKYKDYDGCKFDNTWFIKAANDNFICDLVVKTISQINPNTQIAKGIADKACVTNQSRECNIANCYVNEATRFQFLLGWDCNEKIKNLKYTPNDKEHPCTKGGKLEEICYNGQRYSDISPIDNGIEEVPSYSNLIPSTMYPGLCEVECFCYFPENSLLSTAFEAQYPLPRYFKTTKLLPDKSCVAPPQNGTLTGGLSSLDLRCLGKPEVRNKLDECRDEIRCLTTGELLRVEYHPQRCIVELHEGVDINDERTLCDPCPECNNTNHVRYDIIEYCSNDDLCNDKFKVVETDILPSYNHTTKTWYYNYYDPFAQEYVEVIPCFPSRFGFQAPPSSSKIIMDNQNIKSTKNNQIKVFPNPFNDKINIEVNIEVGEDLEINLVDVLGRVVQFKKISAEKGENRLELDIDNSVPKGIYLLFIKSKNLQKTAFQLVH